MNIRIAKWKTERSRGCVRWGEVVGARAAVSAHPYANLAGDGGGNWDDGCWGGE